jgi:hypothetical protein
MRVERAKIVVIDFLAPRDSGMTAWRMAGSTIAILVQ